MRFRMRVGAGYGQFWRGVIFDREYKNLEDIVGKALRWFPEFGDGAKFVGGSGGFRWRWKTGESLIFRHIKQPKDYWIYHGQEYPYIGWNELSKYPTSELFDAMMSCNRSSFVPIEHPRTDGTLLPEIPLEVFSTTNSYGPGHTWIKRRWIDKGAPGEIVRSTINVFNPRTQQREDVIKMQCRLFGSYKENRFLSPEYVAKLESITEENKKRAWLWGDWDIVAGGAFDDLWGDHLIVPRFKIPRGWAQRLDRSFDWGSTHPFSVGWWAVANGEEVTLPDGTKWAPVAGSLIRIAEWYGAKDFGTNEGLKMSATAIAKGIQQREAKLVEEKWIPEKPRPGPADNSIGDKREHDVETIRAKMSKEGVSWTESDKGPGSRKNGMQLLRDRMEASKTKEGPGVYFMRNCEAAISTLPILPRDEDNMDDVDTTAEDHAYDEIRYRVLAISRTVTSEPLRG